jgi:DNA polymerase elongation subunit (family B)
VPPTDLLVSLRVSREAEDYRTRSPAARAILQLKAAGKSVKPGQRVRLIYTRGKPGVYAWDLPRRLELATVDIARYRDLLLRAALEVLAPFGVTREALLLKPHPACLELSAGWV